MLVLGANPNDSIVIRDRTGAILGHLVYAENCGRLVRLGFVGFEGCEINRKSVDLQKHPVIETQWGDIEEEPLP